MVDVKMFSCLANRRRIVTEYAFKVYEITRSDIFCATEVIEQDIHLCEAFALLWQDWFTGDVDGLWTNTCLLAAIYSCMLLELIALGKITLRKKRSANIYIEVINRERTETFLDKATFSELLDIDDKDEKKLFTRLLKAVKWKFFSSKNYAAKTLGNLQKRKVVRRENECLGLRRLYRTINLEPHGQLEREVRRIALHSKTPDCYIRILLTFCQMADTHCAKSETMLKQYFTQNEYAEGMARVEAVTKEWTLE